MKSSQKPFALHSVKFQISCPDQQFLMTSTQPRRGLGQPRHNRTQCLFEVVLPTGNFQSFIGQKKSGSTCKKVIYSDGTIKISVRNVIFFYLVNVLFFFEFHNLT